MEELVAQLVDRRGVDEGFVLHDVEQPVAHLDLDAHLEPLVVDVETGTQLGGTVEALGDEVVDEFLSVDAFLVVFLGSQVKFGIDAAKDIGSNVVVSLRAVFDVEWELDEGGADGFGERLHLDVAVEVLDGDVVAHATFAETERRDETQVEISAEALAPDDAHGEAWRQQGLHVVHIEALRVLDAVRAVGP